jgi:hypothetical protein
MYAYIYNIMVLNTNAHSNNEINSNPFRCITGRAEKTIETLQAILTKHCMKYILPKETIRTDKSTAIPPVNSSEKVGINSDVTNTVTSNELALIGIPERDKTKCIEESSVNKSANNSEKGSICPDVISAVTSSTIPPIVFPGMDEKNRIDKSKAVTSRDKSEINLFFPGVISVVTSNVTPSISFPRMDDDGDNADPKATSVHNTTEDSGLFLCNATASIDIPKTVDNADDADDADDKTVDNADDADATGGLVHNITEDSRHILSNSNSAISIGLLENVKVKDSTSSISTTVLNATGGIVNSDNGAISNLRNSDSAIGIGPLDNVAVVNSSPLTSTTGLNTTDSTVHGDNNTNNNSRIFTATSFDIGIKVGTVELSLNDDSNIVETVNMKTAAVNFDDPSLMDLRNIDDTVNTNTKVNSTDPCFMDVRDIVDLIATQCDSPDDGIVRVSTIEQHYRSPTSPKIVRVSTAAGSLYPSPINKQNNDSEFGSFQETIRCLLSLISFHLSIGVGGLFDKNGEFKRVFVSDTYKTIVTLEFALTDLGWDSFLKEKCPQQYREIFGAFSTYHLNSELKEGLRWVRLVYLEYVLSFQRRKLREYDLDIYIQSCTSRNIEQFNKKRIIDASRHIYDCSYRSDESFDAEENNSHSQTLQITTFTDSEYDVNNNGKRNFETISHCSNYMQVFQSLKHLICYDAAVNWFVKVQNEACRLHNNNFGDPVERYSEVLYGPVWSLLGEILSGIQDLRVDLIEGVYFYHH